ncbi:MAG: pseudouridine synthase [Candidatus Dactylopiibacterium sp.]|nr:pseudouridine synthase [Candidatus Dactylopiibacterium sp.]
MLRVLYQDDWLVAIDKPAGLLVHRSELDRHETRFAVQMLRDQLGRPVWPVHRLDRGTSGVLLFALDRDTLARAGETFETTRVDKRYLAVVRGWAAESGLIDHPLTRQYDAFESARETPGAPQPARTRFERLATAELPIALDRYPTSRYSLLRLFPETGRRHQIRRHLKHVSHPVIGDATHGKGLHNRMFAERLGCARLLLMCEAMCLPHPVTGAPLHLQTSPSDAFAALLERLGWLDALRPPAPQAAGNATCASSPCGPGASRN